MRLAALLLATALVACQPGPPGGAPGGTPPPGYAFVLANPLGLLALDDRGAVVGRIAELPRDSAAAMPAPFPDGRTIAFSITLLRPGAAGFGSDIWQARLDGSDTKPLLEHDRENVFYAAPLVDPSGKFLYVHRRAAIVKDGTYIGNEDTIERVDLATKQRTNIVDEAADPTLSPDGKTIVFVKIVDGQPQGLWKVPASGGSPRPFFAIGDTWWYLQAPRFSPDGKTVVFSGAGHTARGAQPGTRAGGLAHLGIPSDLFVAPGDGTSVKSLAQTADDVVPAWSPDGARIAFISAGALSVLTVADGGVRQLARGENFFFGDLLWLRR